jgi:peptidoglycan/LPS O-acetylase OafA/YrhL
MAVRLGLAIVMLPILSWMSAGQFAFMFNPPSWSLLMEFVANIFHALVLRRGAVVCAVALILAAAGMAAVVVHFGYFSVGAIPSNVLYTIPRVVFSYTSGIVLFYFWRRRERRWGGLCAALCCLGLVVTLLPWFYVAPLYDAALLLFVFPTLIFFGASCVISPLWDRAGEFLGRVSYPVYILHSPLMLIWPGVLKRIGRGTFLTEAPWGGIGLVLFAVLCGAVAERFYDRPVRAWLQRRLV